MWDPSLQQYMAFVKSPQTEECPPVIWDFNFSPYCHGSICIVLTLLIPVEWVCLHKSCLALSCVLLPVIVWVFCICMGHETPGLNTWTQRYSQLFSGASRNVQEPAFPGAGDDQEALSYFSKTRIRSDPGFLGNQDMLWTCTTEQQGWAPDIIPTRISVSEPIAQGHFRRGAMPPNLCPWLNDTCARGGGEIKRFSEFKTLTFFNLCRMQHKIVCIIGKN